jgi:hypothetical protein
MSFTEFHVKNETQSTSKHNHDKQYREDNVISSEILDLYNEANVIIQKKKEKIIVENNKRGAFIISKQVFKKSFLLFICAFYCLIFNGVLGGSISTYVDGFNTNKVESYLCAVLLLLKVLLLIWLERRQKYVKSFERVQHAENVVEYIKTSYESAIKESSNVAINQVSYSSDDSTAVNDDNRNKNTRYGDRNHRHVRKQFSEQFSSSSSSLSAALVFRDNRWQLVPTNLLVKNEIIAVGAGAPFPARVKVLDPQTGEREIYNHGEQFESVTESDTSSSTNDDDYKILRGLNVAEPRPLLKQMGHLRRFKLLETPFCIYLKSYLSDEKMLHTDDDDKTPYQLEKKMLEQYFYMGFIALCSLCLVVNAIRCFVMDEKHVIVEEIDILKNYTNTTMKPTTTKNVRVSFSHISWPSIGAYTQNIFSNNVIEHWSRLLILRLVLLVVVGVTSISELLDALVDAQATIHVLSTFDVLMSNRKIVKQRSIFYEIYYGKGCGVNVGCSNTLMYYYSRIKYHFRRKCRRRPRRRNKDHYDCCYCFGRRLKCRTNRSFPFCQCSLKKIKVDEEDEIMMDDDFDYDDDDNDNYNSAISSAAINNDNNNINKNTSSDTVGINNYSNEDRNNSNNNLKKYSKKFIGGNFYKVLSKMDRDERQSKARFRRNHAYVPLCKYISQLYSMVKQVYFGNSDIESTEVIIASNRLLSINLVERLGRATRLCCADESAATASEPCVEEIFFLQGDKSHDHDNDGNGLSDTDTDDDDNNMNHNENSRSSVDHTVENDEHKTSSDKKNDGNMKNEDSSNSKTGHKNYKSKKTSGDTNESISNSNSTKKAQTNTGLDLTDEYYQAKKIKHDRSFILDLCRDTSQPHNVRFEVPNWEKKYMLSLKPIGLCALLCGNAGIDETNSLQILGDDMYTQLAKAVAHRSWWDSDRALKQLAYAIGFKDSDLNIYRRRSRVHVIAPSMEKEEEERLIRPHRWITSIPQLRTHMSTIVVEDLHSKRMMQHKIKEEKQQGKKTRKKDLMGNLSTKSVSSIGQLHLMSCGHPVAVLGRCRQFWQGDTGSIWPLKKSDRTAILEMYEQWTREGFDCRTCAYTPCVPEMASELHSLRKKVDLNFERRKNREDQQQIKNDANDIDHGVLNLNNNNSISNNNGEFQYTSFYLTMTEDEIKAAFSSAVYKNKDNDDSNSKAKRDVYHDDNDSNMINNSGDKELSYTPTEAFNQEYMLSRQIFLGMLASRSQPKEEMVGVIEDLDQAGIRFVYFSPRNPKRAKIMAQQMGLEVGWNSSVSLVSEFKDSGWTPDQWDTRAKLPHGVEEIREHIKTVDNVPLLVSLYTDSKTKATKEMLKVFKENNEIICVFGSALRASNSSLFQDADVAFGVDYVEDNVSVQHSRINNYVGISKNGTNESVILPNDEILSLSGRLNTLSCAMTLPWSGSTYALVDLIGLCRKFLENKKQSLHYFYITHCIIGVTLLISSLTSLPPPLSIGTVMYISWVVIPAFSMSLINAPGVTQPMQKMAPNKNELVEISKKRWKHLVYYSSGHILPTAIVSYFVYNLALESILINHTNIDGKKNYNNYDYANNISYRQDIIDSVHKARSLLCFFLVWTFAFVALNFETRCESLWYRLRRPLNTALLIVSFTFCIAHLVQCLFVYNWFSGNNGNNKTEGGGYFLVSIIIIFTWPIFLTLIVETIKRYDRYYVRMQEQRRRIVFDTKLGMWSPK